MASVTIHKAKTELSKLIARVEAGEEIVILRKDKPVARLTSLVAEVKPKRVPGIYPQFKGISDDFFFKPMEEDDLKLWEGRE